MNKKLGLALTALFVSSAYAEAAPSFKVLLREEKNNKTYYAQKEMPDLESETSFDGKYFKVVLSKDKEAVSFEEKDQEILLKAATVYYHLNEARSFWVNYMQSEVAANLPKLTIRIDMKNQFDELGHFANDNRTPQFNNALSIPNGETPSWVPADKQDKWDKEIWFRPSKTLLTKDMGPTGPNPLTVGLQALQNPLIDYTQNQINVRLMEQIFYPSYATNSLGQDLLQYAGTIALFKVIVEGSKHADRLFMEKYFFLDTAMVPEIAYHEYSHVVLSDHLQMSHSTPMNEGMADYFAAVQAGKRKIYAKVAGRSNAAAKDTQSKQKYSHWTESNRMASADFTLSVLWDVRETLGEEMGDKVVYQARKYLRTENSTVSDGLLRSILQACDDVCEFPRRDKYKLYKTFEWKGF